MSGEILFVCWKWRQEGCRSSYSAEHANVWNRMVRRHCTLPLRTVCITDDPKGVDFDTFPLWGDHATVQNPNGSHLPSCYRRLKIFSREVTDALGVPEGGGVVSTDLDVVILKNVDPMFVHDAPFLGWKRIGPTKPIGYNGSLFMFRAGEMERLWTSFDPATSPMRARRAKQYGSDQGWISYVIAGTAPGWTQASGVYSYSADVRLKRLPLNARIVSFNGRLKPWMTSVMRADPWVRQNWK